MGMAAEITFNDAWTWQSVEFTDLRLDLPNVYQNLGFGLQAPDEWTVQMSDTLLHAIATHCFPQIGYRIIQGVILENQYLNLESEHFDIGRDAASYVNDCRYFAVFVVTAGNEFEAFCRKITDTVTAYFAYAIGTEIVDAAARHVLHQIDALASCNGFCTTQSISPGHGDWQVQEQRNLFRLLPPSPCGIQLTPSNLMIPEKSVSGIVGIGTFRNRQGSACGMCRMPSCYKRKE